MLVNLWKFKKSNDLWDHKQQLEVKNWYTVMQSCAYRKSLIFTSGFWTAFLKILKIWPLCAVVATKRVGPYSISLRLNVNADCFYQTLLKLRRFIQHKRHGMFNICAELIHDDSFAYIWLICNRASARIPLACV